MRAYGCRTGIEKFFLSHYDRLRRFLHFNYVILFNLFIYAVRKWDYCPLSAQLSFNSALLWCQSKSSTGYCENFAYNAMLCVHKWHETAEFVPSDTFDYSICIWRRINCQRQSTVLIISFGVGSRRFKLISSSWSQPKTRQQCVCTSFAWRCGDGKTIPPENGLFGNNSPLSRAPAFISVCIINALNYFMHLTIPRSRRENDFVFNVSKLLSS